MELIIGLATKFWQWSILIAVVIIGAIINFADKKAKTKLNFITKACQNYSLYQLKQKARVSGKAL